jgi:hypothetical protein
VIAFFACRFVIGGAEDRHADRAFDARTGFNEVAFGGEDPIGDDDVPMRMEGEVRGKAVPT